LVDLYEYMMIQHGLTNPKLKYSSRAIQVMPCPSISKSFPIQYSLTNPPFDVLQSKLMTVSLNDNKFKMYNSR